MNECEQQLEIPPQSHRHWRDEIRQLGSKRHHYLTLALSEPTLQSVPLGISNAVGRGDVGGERLHHCPGLVRRVDYAKGKKSRLVFGMQSRRCGGGDEASRSCFLNASWPQPRLCLFHNLVDNPPLRQQRAD